MKVQLRYSTSYVFATIWENKYGDMAFRVLSGYIILKASDSAGETFEVKNLKGDVLLNISGDAPNRKLKYAPAGSHSSFGKVSKRPQAITTLDEDGDKHAFYYAPAKLVKKLESLDCTKQDALDESFNLNPTTRLVPLEYGLAYFLNVGISHPLTIYSEGM